MKRIFISALLAVGLVTAIFQVSAVSKAARPTEDYPLVCRGGGSLVIGIAPGERNIGFTFSRGTNTRRKYAFTNLSWPHNHDAPRARCRFHSSSAEHSKPRAAKTNCTAYAGAGPTHPAGR